MIDPTVPGTVLWIATDASGGDALVRSLRICDEERRKVRVLFEIQRWQPFKEEFKKPADFVIAKFDREARLPCPCTIAFVRSSDCAIENAVAGDRAFLREDQPRHVEMDVTTTSGPIPLPGCGMTLMEILLTGGRSSRKHIRAVNEMRANAVSSVLKAIRSYRNENGEWPQSHQQLWRWLDENLEYNFPRGYVTESDTLSEEQVNFRATVISHESATFVGSVIGLEFNETIEV
ncbi:MAG: hypothetical protein M3R13_06740 [Armatimonadota bacterium]|nr:hypothetical protein [Armatimonadota bacterium]